MLHPVSIELPLKIIEKITEDIEGTSIKTVEDFVKSLVMQRYPELNERVYKEEEEEMIKQRLEKLGYL